MAMEEPCSSFFSACSSLIPGLPDDLALLCLARVPRTLHPRLRSVCCSWNRLLTGQTFYRLRRRTGSLQESLFLFDHNRMDNTVKCTEFDIKSGAQRDFLFRNPNPKCRTLLVDSVCFAIGPLVMILGGWCGGDDEDDGEGGDAEVSKCCSGQLCIFDTSDGSSRMGASMQYGRGDFAWGVVDGRLYVAGGLGGPLITPMTVAETYDPVTDEWTRIADMPSQMAVDLFCAHKGRLLVRGYIPQTRTLQLFSYNPCSNQWSEDAWLNNLLLDVKPRSYMHAILSTMAGDDSGGALYIAEIQRAGGTPRSWLKLLKLDPERSRWDLVFEHLDDMPHVHFQCPVVSRGRFQSLLHKILVMVHAPPGGSQQLQLTHRSEVVQASSSCLSWAEQAIICL